MSYDFNDVSDNKLSDEVCQSYRYEVQMLDKGTGEWGCLCTFDSLDGACAHLELVSKHVHSYDVPGWRVRKFCESYCVVFTEEPDQMVFTGSLEDCQSNLDWLEKWTGRACEIWERAWVEEHEQAQQVLA